MNLAVMNISGHLFRSWESEQPLQSRLTEPDPPASPEPDVMPGVVLDDGLDVREH